MDKIEGEIIAIVAGILKVNQSDLQLESSGDSIHQWDSLAHASIISAVEEYFDIKFDVMDIIQMRTIDDIINTVKKVS
ncbi:acyl carrier protein [Carboxylicivirga caseinilyticus]|uniref:acyl carrier protein n=1 Tax=Carboxylicivirga caseinilyticus TaxID=3417572 RepID=UPI003D33E777|nr:acyl carrier protein [Marinilabiliaceae bacterium A049]